MNILYHSKEFIVQYDPPAGPDIRDENTVQAALDGVKEIRVLTTAATQRIMEPGRAAVVEEESAAAALVRSETLKGGRTQLFTLPVGTINEIYGLSDQIEYICPYQAAIRAYVNYRFKETQDKLRDSASVIFVDVEANMTFITVLDEDAVEIFRAVATEELATEFQRTIDYYTHTRLNRDLFLMVNNQKTSSELISTVGGLLGPDVVPEPCPALWALHALEVTPRFLLPEIEARKELKRQRAKSLVHLSVSGVAAGLAAVIASSLYFSNERYRALIVREDEAILRLKAEISKEASEKYPALLKSLQPSWTELIAEIALTLPEGAKIRKMTITDSQTGVNLSTRRKKYLLNIRAALEDSNPMAVGRAQASVAEKLKRTKYLRRLSVEVAPEMDSSLSLTLTGPIEVGEGHA